MVSTSRGNMTTIKVFHASDTQLQMLNYEALLQNIKNHDNGALGLWCAFDSQWIKPFGCKMYELEVSGSFYDMTIHELAKYNRDGLSREDYTARRNELISQGFDYIRLLESDGRCDMIILLDFSKAKISLFSI